MTRVVLAAVLALAMPAAARAAAVPIPPTPSRWATDTAEFLTPATLQSVDRTLEDFERSSSNQVLVWIGRTTGDAPLEDWTVRAFAAWKVGRKGLDNGLILFVFADDRAVRIEVGYGLEGQVPDAIASRIINETIIPKIRAGDRDGAIVAGVVALIARISGREDVLSESRDATGSGEAIPGGSPQRQFSKLEIAIGAIIAVLFLVLLITNPQFALYLLVSFLTSGAGSRGGSGGGGSGGGFSGGGGSSGGGGASGRW
jgi:uncharacterized protein